MPQPVHKSRKRIMSLEGRTERVFQALVACGPGWHGRVEIAKKLGVPRAILQREDVALLAALAEAGRIKAKVRADPVKMTMYRLTEEEWEKIEEIKRAGQPPAKQ